MEKRTRNKEVRGNDKHEIRTFQVRIQTLPLSLRYLIGVVSFYGSTRVHIDGSPSRRQRIL